MFPFSLPTPKTPVRFRRRRAPEPVSPLERFRRVPTVPPLEKHTRRIRRPRRLPPLSFQVPEPCCRNPACPKYVAIGSEWSTAPIPPPNQPYAAPPTGSDVYILLVDNFSRMSTGGEGHSGSSQNPGIPVSPPPYKAVHKPCEPVKPVAGTSTPSKISRRKSLPVPVWRP